MDKPTVTFAPPDHKYIQCDAKDCGLVSPQLRCSRCRCVYYCSKTCQINHWPKHKSECRDVNILKARFREPGDNIDAPVDMTQKVKAAAEMICGICLEETMEKPHALSHCQHVFCYPCLQAYQNTCKQVNQPLRCPLCRADTDDVQKRHWEAAAFHLVKGVRRPKSSVERKELLQSAISELEQISKDDRRLYFQVLITKMTTLALLDEHESVLTVIDELLFMDISGRENYDKFVRTKKLSDFDENKFYRLTDEDRIEVCVQRASTYEKMENWKQALQSYKDVWLERKIDPFQRHFTIMGLSRCSYHLKDFDKAIGFGETAIQKDRHQQEAHKYVALSYKAKGDLETAIKLMSQAVLYETPWDEENIYQAKVLLDELIKSVDNKSSVA